MWDRFYDNKSNYLAKETSESNQCLKIESFSYIESIIESAWKRPEVKGLLINLFKEKLYESKFKGS